MKRALRPQVESREGYRDAGTALPAEGNQVEVTVTRKRSHEELHLTPEFDHCSSSQEANKTPNTGSTCDEKRVCASERVNDENENRSTESKSRASSQEIAVI